MLYWVEDICKGTLGTTTGRRKYTGFSFIAGIGDSSEFHRAIKGWCEENMNPDQYQLNICWPDWDRMHLMVFDEADAMAVKLVWDK